MTKGNVRRVLSAVVFIIQIIRILSFDYQHVNDWSATDKQCAGSKQSPINILSSAPKPLVPGLLVMSGGDIKPESVNVMNTGVTVVFKPNYATEKPTISGGPLTDVYVFDSLHFHWSLTDSLGSEHTYDGKHFPLEMYLVHYKQIYGSFEEAKKQPDGLATVAANFDFPFPGILKPNTTALVPLINGISKVKKVGATTNIPPFLLSRFGLKKRYPYRFITYQGSLTTPPCSEIVTWLLSTIPIDMSAEQFQAFQEVEFANSDTANKRPVQLLNGRTLQYVLNSSS